MWDRLRSATGGGGAGGSGSPDQHHPQGRDSPSSSSSSRVDRKGRAATSPSLSNPSNSWQPRSSVIAARQPSLDSGPYHFAAKAGPPPPRPPREFEAPRPAPAADPPTQQQRQHHQQEYHPPPRSQTLPMPTTHAQRNVYRDSVGRPPSSVYSQQSPLNTEFPRRQPQNGPGVRHANSPDEVSPPSSPELDRAGHVPNHDISPIDEEDDFPAPQTLAARAAPHESVPNTQILQAAPSMSAHGSLPSQQRTASRQADRDGEVSSSPQPSPRSSIPMMRREQRRAREAEAAANRTKDKVRFAANAEVQAQVQAQVQDEARVPPARPRTTSRGGGLRATTPVDRSTKMTTDKPRGQKDPRWDPMTGEITSSDKGRPSQVKPVEFARGLGISTMASHTPGSPEREKDRQLLSRGGSKNGGRVGTGGGPGAGAGAKMSDTDPAAAAFTANRPGWRGASGRTAIVDAVKDNTEVAPLKIPPRSTKRGSPRPPSTEPTSSSSGVDSGVAGLGLSPPGSPGITLIRREQPVSPVQTAGTPTPAKQQQMGGGGGAGKDPLPTGPASPASPTSPASPASPAKSGLSLANTFRKIMPSSASSSSASAPAQNKNKLQSRLFGAGGTISPPGRNDSPKPNQRRIPGVQGYPSPPLSGGPTPLPADGPGARGGTGGLGGGSTASPGAVRTNNNNFSNYIDANATNNADVNASAPAPAPGSSAQHHHRPITLQPATDESQQPTPTPSPTASGLHTPATAIRRKEVGSAVLVGPFPGLDTATSNTSNTAHHHQPHESFSSSVYSRPDDDFTNLVDQPPPPLPPLPSSASRQPTTLDAKNLPKLPPGASALNDDPNSPYVQPPSRFSITTYATSAHTSPRGSFSVDADAPPMPTPPSDLAATMNRTETSVLERKRPEMRGGKNKWDEPEHEEEPVKISLSKAWMTTAGANSAGINAQTSPPRTRKDPLKGPRAPPSNRGQNKENEKGGGRAFGFGLLSSRLPAAASDSNSNSSRPASVMSNMDKDLPPAPSQDGGVTTSTHDRIAQLNSQLQDLANRRLNINRAIRQMTELMPQDNLMLPDEVRQKREVEKRKIEDLNAKLADLGREEHDLGMKLHRAYKKLDKQTEYEPTTLWVRRATGS